MSKRGLDNVTPLRPAFTDQSDDPLRRKEREALRMAHVLKGLAAQRQDQEMRRNREKRKQDFLQKRGRPALTLTPGRGFAHKQAVEAEAYREDFKAEQKRAQKKAHTVAKRASMRAAQPSREERKAAFIAQRTSQPAPDQSRSQTRTQTATPPAVAKTFARARDDSSSGATTRAAQHKPAPAPTPTVRRTSFARTLDR